MCTAHGHLWGANTSYRWPKMCCKACSSLWLSHTPILCTQPSIVRGNHCQMNCAADIAGPAPPSSCFTHLIPAHSPHLTKANIVKRTVLLILQGLLLPLAASRTCTLREAVIFSAVLRRTSIPVLHSAAALLRMVSAFSVFNPLFIFFALKCFPYLFAALSCSIAAYGECIFRLQSLVYRLCSKVFFHVCVLHSASVTPCIVSAFFVFNPLFIFFALKCFSYLFAALSCSIAAYGECIFRLQSLVYLLRSEVFSLSVCCSQLQHCCI